VGSDDPSKLGEITKRVNITGENITFKNTKVYSSVYVKGNNSTLDNVSITGTLFLDPGSQGTATLNNVKATKVIILSGAKDSIHFKNSEVGTLLVSSSSEVRIESTGTTRVGDTVVSSYAVLDAMGGTLGHVEVVSIDGQAPIVTLRGTFSEPIVVGCGATIIADSNSMVAKLEIAPESVNQKVTLDGNFATVEVNQKTTIELSTKTNIKNVVVNSATNLNVPSGAKIGKLEENGNSVSVTGSGSIGETLTPSSGGGGSGGSVDQDPEFSITSSAFVNNLDIPDIYTYQGGNRSIPLTIANVPSGTQSLALILYDSDAGNFVHWVVKNIPAVTTSLAENISGSMPTGCVELRNTNHLEGYFGPQPPARHQYILKLYALNVTSLDSLINPEVGTLNLSDFNAAIEGKTLGSGTLSGYYTPPVPVMDFANLQSTATTATFTWTAPTEATRLRIQQSLNGDNWSDASIEGGALLSNAATAVVSGLTENTHYYFKLVTIGGVNRGDSNVVSVKTANNSSLSIQPHFVDGGDEHSLALKSDGTVLAWGNNLYGQLGNESTLDQTFPVQVSSLTDVVSVASGNYHSIALKADGTVWGWGRNEGSILGSVLGSTNYKQTTPFQISELTDVAAIAAGAYFSVALKNDGTVWAWGNNFYGQLGNGIANVWSRPVQVSNLVDVKAIAVGEDHALAVKDDGTVWAWGNNSHGQLGSGDLGVVKAKEPVQVLGLSDVKAVAAGYAHSLALKGDGTVWAWGLNGCGQLGHWNNNSDQAVPSQVVGLTGVTSIAAGWEWSLALKEGLAFAWGDNNWGQLGEGTSNIKTSIVQVTRLTNLKEISAGKEHTLAILNDNTLWAWGRSNKGQLGSANDMSYIPVKVGTKNSTISPSTVTFDKNVSKQADIDVTITLNGNTLTSIKNGGIPLVVDRDYSVSGNVLTLQKEYLATLGVGEVILTFEFSAGNHATLTITVTLTASEEILMIHTVDELKGINQGLDKHYKLANDINLNNQAWSPLGSALNKFTGVFDGDNHVITGLKISIRDSTHIGLFALTGESAIIKNVGLEAADVSCSESGYMGTLIGTNYGTVLNSYAKGIAYGRRGIGGLVGVNFGIINGCYSQVFVTASQFDVGGLVGSNAGTISNSYATGNVEEVQDGVLSVGGLVGSNSLASENSWGIIRDSYASGSVKGTYKVGGLVGNNNQALIEDSYALGNVMGADKVGGLVGYALKGTIRRSDAKNKIIVDKRNPPVIIMNNFGRVVGLLEGTPMPTLEFNYASDDMVFKHYVLENEEAVLRPDNSFFGQDGFTTSGKNGANISTKAFQPI
jgi:Raf kinase inhibitor-like YbhB/YbcL family protein